MATEFNVVFIILNCKFCLLVYECFLVLVVRHLVGSAHIEVA
jgi:hypothetical protein